MIRALSLLLLCLPGCTNIREAINCSNGAKLRAAAEKAIQAVDRACPIVLEAK